MSINLRHLVIAGIILACVSCTGGPGAPVSSASSGGTGSSSVPSGLSSQSAGSSSRGSSSSRSSAGTTNTTLYPVMDFYINRASYSDNNAIFGYGSNIDATNAEGRTGSETDTYNARPCLVIYKLLYNFNISSLSGANIQSAYFSIYLKSYLGTSLQSALFENIFYGNTDTFPVSRSSSNEFCGYIISPAITEVMAVNTTGWKTVDVTAKLQADINASRANSQFRLSHTNTTQLLNYFCTWYMADTASSYKPKLIITYIK